MVVDIGAGTVDFGMFASGLRGEHIGVHPVANAKYSLPVGGNDIDRALTAYILDKAQLNGRRRTEVAARLGEERVRVMKENFFDGYPGYEEPVAEANIYVRKEDFLDSDHWNAFVQKVSVEFRNRLAAVHGSWLELASSLTRPNDKIDVFLSGGGARLPFLREMIPPAAPQSINNSPLFFVKVASDAPQWTTERGYAQAWRQVESDYPQLAVSLGGAVFGAGVNEHLAMHQELNQWSGAIRR
ncbi:MAG: hypothetical protein F4089_02650 [Gammaproteobacteria bacterium]|nr:hypothetical protein [Gammaproteobacteria bacterium]